MGRASDRKVLLARNGSFRVQDRCFCMAEHVLAILPHSEAIIWAEGSGF